MVKININSGLSFRLDESTIRAIEKNVNLDLSLEEKLKFFIEKLIIASYIEKQPADILRMDNPNYKFFQLKFDRQQAEKILDELDNRDYYKTVKEMIGHIFEDQEE